MRLDLRKQIGDKDIKIETVLEQALHLEAVTRTEEEEQTPKAAVFRRDETKDLVEAVTKFVNQLSVDDKQRENRRNQSRERRSSRRRWGDDRRDRRQQQDRGFNSRRRFPTPGPSHEADLSDEMNRLGGTTGKVSNAEPVDKKDTIRGIVEIVSYVEAPNT